MKTAEHIDLLYIGQRQSQNQLKDSRVMMILFQEQEKFTLSLNKNYLNFTDNFGKWKLKRKVGTENEKQGSNICKICKREVNAGNTKFKKFINVVNINQETNN